jgi:hypothetical protein
MFSTRTLFAFPEYLVWGVLMMPAFEKGGKIFYLNDIVIMMPYAFIYKTDCMIVKSSLFWRENLKLKVWRFLYYLVPILRDDQIAVMFDHGLIQA